MVAALLAVLRRLIADRRPPDLVIGGEERPYMRRWYVIPRNSVFNIYLHHVLRDDDDRALHDHPWVNCSIVMSGGYHEWVPRDGNREFHPGASLSPDGSQVILWRPPGSFVFRWPSAAHRLTLPTWEFVSDAAETFVAHAPVMLPSPDVWSLFLTGPRWRTWGFRCPQGWRPWQEFTSGPRGETVGKGCD